MHTAKRARLVLYTIGHGSRGLDEFVGLLQHAGIACLVDVRAHPGSRRHPHFSREALAASLRAHGIDYTWEGSALGGRRRPRADSPHRALRNESFRAYADHMGSPEFGAAVDRLVARAAREAAAIMCAERLPWRCHRFLIADYLVAHGVEVRHLIDRTPAREHRLHAVARIEDGALVYDRPTQAALDMP